MRLLLTALVALVAGTVTAADAKKLLLVTDSGGFIHDSVGLAEQVLKEVGPKHGIEVTCYRYTRDPMAPGFAKYAEDFRKRTGVPVEPEHCGRVNAETLKKFDAVLFFTTGNPLANDEVKDLVDWVKAGGAIAGTHCGSDTLYPAADRKWNQAYGELIGAYFKTHPPGFQKIKIRVEDPKHPAAAAFKDGEAYEDEMYIFRDAPYSRNRLHIILSVSSDSVDSLLAKAPKAARGDNDYAISWCQEVEKGRSFYTSLGHRKEVWKDPRFQEHLIGGLKWAMKQAPGDATPSAKLKKD
ncbi:MAG TPA: ThuA domain-containing protein [Gemmataceae bacterium]|nr:ThuA domain-containing protein [Gemmataceae bacterium]